LLAANRNRAGYRSSTKLIDFYRLLDLINFIQLQTIAFVYNEHSSYTTSNLGTKDSSSRKNRSWVNFVLHSEISRKECRARLAFAFSSDHEEVTRRKLLFLIIIVVVIIIILKSLVFVPEKNTASSS